MLVEGLQLRPDEQGASFNFPFLTSESRMQFQNMLVDRADSLLSAPESGGTQETQRAYGQRVIIGDDPPNEGATVAGLPGDIYRLSTPPVGGAQE
jgi:hypothetical protein